MNRRPTNGKIMFVGVVLAAVMIAPTHAQALATKHSAAAHAAPTPAVSAVRDTNRTLGRSSTAQADAPASGGGIGWREAVIGAGILLAIFLMGVWGDSVIGVAVVGVAGLAKALAKLAASPPWNARAASNRRVQADSQERAALLPTGNSQG